MVCSNLKFVTDHNFFFTEKYHGLWYFVKNRLKYTFDFNTSSKQTHCKLSENHKINVIRTNGTEVMAKMLYLTTHVCSLFLCSIAVARQPGRGSRRVLYRERLFVSSHQL